MNQDELIVLCSFARTSPSDGIILGGIPCKDKNLEYLSNFVFIFIRFTENEFFSFAAHGNFTKEIVIIFLWKESVFSEHLL